MSSGCVLADHPGDSCCMFPVCQTKGFGPANFRFDITASLAGIFLKLVQVGTINFMVGIGTTTPLPVTTELSSTIIESTEQMTTDMTTVYSTTDLTTQEESSLSLLNVSREDVTTDVNTTVLSSSAALNITETASNKVDTTMSSALPTYDLGTKILYEASTSYGGTTKLTESLTYDMATTPSSKNSTVDVATTTLLATSLYTTKKTSYFPNITTIKTRSTTHKVQTKKSTKATSASTRYRVVHKGTQTKRTTRAKSTMKTSPVLKLTKKTTKNHRRTAHARTTKTTSPVLKFTKKTTKHPRLTSAKTTKKTPPVLKFTKKTTKHHPRSTRQRKPNTLQRKVTTLPVSNIKQTTSKWTVSRVTTTVKTYSSILHTENQHISSFNIGKTTTMGISGVLGKGI